MSSVCISKCVSDARDPRMPVRATYVNLYKWPESDAEFVRSVSSKSFTGGRSGGDSGRFGHPRIVDSVSCRQMYLRSYKFSREETVPEKTQKCFGIGKTGLLDDHHAKKKGESKRNSTKKKRKKKKCLFLGKVKDVSRDVFRGIFRGCLLCAATVDVVDRQD